MVSAACIDHQFALVEAVAVAGLRRVGKDADNLATGAAGPELVRSAFLFPGLARISVGGRVAVDVRTQQNKTYVPS